MHTFWGVLPFGGPEVRVTTKAPRGQSFFVGLAVQAQCHASSCRTSAARQILLRHAYSSRPTGWPTSSSPRLRGGSTSRSAASSVLRCMVAGTHGTCAGPCSRG